MYVPEKRTAVVRVPKCGSTSIAETLRDRYDVKYLHNHLTLRQLTNRHEDIILGMTTVREPVDRLRSAAEHALLNDAWNNLPMVRDAFFHALKNKLAQGFYAVFYPQYSYMMADISVRFYSINNMSLLLSDIGVPVQAPRLNTTPGKISKEEVLSCFGEDFVYSFYSIDFSLWSNVLAAGSSSLRVENSKEYLLSLKENL